MADLGSASGRIEFLFDGAGIDQAKAGLASLDQAGANAGRNMQTVGVGITAIGAAGTVAFGSIITGAGDFEAAMNNIGSVTGATDAELAGLSETALTIGQDTAFSAQQGAAAITELGKAGIPVKDIMGGAAEATADLAGAGEVDMARAAEVMSNAMNIFQIEGGKAADVADILAAGANSSASSVDGLADGMANAGPAAAALGLDLDDTVAALALLSDRGLSGAEAGTKLRGVLADLTPATKPARAEFDKLGLSVGESGNAFFNASGQFVGMEEASTILYDSLKGLTDVQRAQSLETIFGTYNAGAAEVMFQAQKAAVEGTGKGYAEYNTEVRAAGQATEVSNAKMAGMNGALEALGGSVDTLRITLGTGLTPVIEFAADALATVVNTLIELPAPVQTVIAALTGLVGVLGVGLGAAILIVPKILEFKNAMTKLSLASKLAGVAFGPLGIAMAAVGLGVLAYKTNFLGFGDAVDGIVSKVQLAANVFLALKDALGPGEAALRALETAFPAVGAAARALADMVGPVLSNAFKTVQTTVENLRTAFEQFRLQGFDPLAAAFEAFRAVFPGLTGAIDAAQAVVNNFITTLKGIGAGLGEALAALQAGDFGGVLEGLFHAAQAAIEGFVANLGIIKDALFQLFEGIDWGAVSQTLLSGLQTVSIAILGWVQEQATTILTAFSTVNWASVADAIVSGITNALTTAGNFAGMLLQKGADLVAGLVQGVADHLPEVAAKLGEIATGVAGVLPDALTALLQKGADLVAGIVQGIGDHLPDVAAKLGEIATGFGAVLPDALTALVQKGADLVAGLVQGIGDHLPDVATKLGDIATGLATVLPEALTLLVDKGADLIAGLVQGIGDHLPDVATKLGEIATGLADVLPDAATALLDKGADLIAGIVQGIGDHLPEVGTKLEELATTVTGVLPDAATLLVDKGSQLITGLQAGIDAAWIAVNAWLENLDVDIGESVGTLADTLTSRGTELITGLKTAAEAAWTTVTEWLGTLSESVTTNTITDALTLLSQKGTDLITGLKTAAETAWATVTDWLGTLSALASAAVTGMLEALVTQGTELLTGLKTGAQDVWNNDLGPWLQSLPQLASDAVTGMLEALLPKGQELMTGLQTGVQDGWNNVVGPYIQSIPQLISDALGNLSGILFNKGVELMVGLKDGITAGLGGVLEAINGVAGQISGALGGVATAAGDLVGGNFGAGAVQATEAAAPAMEAAGAGLISSGVHGAVTEGGIRSPSKVMYQVGVDFVQGLLNAILDRLKDATAAGTQLANAAITPIKETASAQVAQSLGSVFSAGWADGLRAKITDAVNAAIDLAMQPIAALRAATATEPALIGANVGTQFALGLSSKGAEIIAIAEEIAAQVNAALNEALGTTEGGTTDTGGTDTTDPNAVDPGKTKKRERRNDRKNQIDETGRAADETNKKLRSMGEGGRQAEVDIDESSKRMSKSLDSVGEAGGKAGKKAADSMAVAIKSGEPTFVKVVSESVEAATLNGEKIGKDFSRVSTTMIDSAGNKMKESSKSFEQAAASVVDGAVTEGRKNAHTGGRGIGDDIGRGLVDGLRGQISAAEAAGRAIANAAADGARNASRSHSPSLVAREIGRDWGDGFGIGITDRQRDAARAAASLIPINGPAGSRSGSGAGGVVVNNYIANQILPGIRNPEQYMREVARQSTLSARGG